MKRAFAAADDDTPAWQALPCQTAPLERQTLAMLFAIDALCQAHAVDDDSADESDQPRLRMSANEADAVVEYVRRDSNIDVGACLDWHVLATAIARTDPPLVGLEALVSAKPSLLGWAGNVPNVCDGLRAIRGVSVRSTNNAGAHMFNDDVFAFIANTFDSLNNTYEKIFICEGCVNDAGIALIAQALASLRVDVTIEQLWFVGTNFGIDGARAINRLFSTTTHVHVLGLEIAWHMQPVTAAMLELLIRFDALTWLRLVGCGLDDNAVDVVADAIRMPSTLVHVSVARNSGITDIGGLALARAAVTRTPATLKIDVYYTRMSNYNFTTFCKWHGLEFVARDNSANND